MRRIARISGAEALQFTAAYLRGLKRSPTRLWRAVVQVWWFPPFLLKDGAPPVRADTRKKQILDVAQDDSFKGVFRTTALESRSGDGFRVAFEMTASLLG
jgi:hypothetical protein